MKKCVAILMIGIVLMAGCTGPFRLTKSVHNWQTSFDSKWVDELVFLGCVIIPVYGLSMLGDGIIFNSIEFWGGTNPISEAQVESDGRVVKMTLGEDGVICLTDGQQTLTLEKTAAGVIARNAQGEMVYRAVRDEDNVVSVYDASGTLVKRSDS